jgi:predicted nuclease with TOPRIM domain
MTTHLLEKKITEQNEIIKKYMAQNEALQTDYQAIQADYQAIQADYQAIQADYQELQMQEQKLRIDHQKLKIDYHALQQDNQSLYRQTLPDFVPETNHENIEESPEQRRKRFDRIRLEIKQLIDYNDCCGGGDFY